MTKEERTKHRKLLILFLGVLDVIATICTLVTASWIVDSFTEFSVAFDDEFALVTLVVLITWVILLKATQLARIPRTSAIPIMLSDFIKLSLMGGFILLILDWAVKLDNFPALALALFIVLNFFVLFVIRIITFKTIKHFRANGHNTRNVVIIANDSSESIINKIINQREWGFKILHIITDSELIKHRFGKLVKIHPRNVNIKSLVRFDIVDELICFDYIKDKEKFYSLIDYCSELGVTVRILGHNISPGDYKTRIQYFDNMPFITIENNPINKFNHVVKTIVEIFVSFNILFVLSPFLLMIGVLIGLTSKGPIVFKQERVGLRRRKFYIYKFRTMVVNAEELKAKLLSLNESCGPTFKIKQDPRITKIGNFLRKTCLDEIPQLFNVIKGEMSLVGPRPPIPSEVDQYEEWQLKRLAVKPGLTCTWQIDPNRNKVKFDKWVKMDIQYIDNWSLKSDLELFFKTFKTVLFARGA